MSCHSSALPLVASIGCDILFRSGLSRSSTLSSPTPPRCPSPCLRNKERYGSGSSWPGEGGFSGRLPKECLRWHMSGWASEAKAMRPGVPLRGAPGRPGTCNKWWRTTCGGRSLTNRRPIMVLFRPRRSSSDLTTNRNSYLLSRNRVARSNADVTWSTAAAGVKHCWDNRRPANAMPALVAASSASRNAAWRSSDRESPSTT